MFIVIVVSNSTLRNTYYGGYISEEKPGQLTVENIWTEDIRFATRFATHGLATRVAEAFAALQNQNVDLHFYVISDNE